MKLFKNGCIVDIENGHTKLADFLVGDDGKIKQIAKEIKADCQEIDLKGNYVLPAFVNAYSESKRVLSCSYEIENQDDEKLAQQLLLVKNLLAGAVFLNDNPPKLENIGEFSEAELSQLSEDFAKTKERCFMKVGRDLFELGEIDKLYKKTLAEVLEDFGFLDRNCVLVGGNCLEKDELQLLKRYDVPVVLTPNEDGRLGRRVSNLNTLRHLGFDVSFGSGTFAEIDFFAFMRQLVSSQRSLFENQSVLSESDALLIACNSSFLGFENKIKEKNLAHFAVVKKENTLQNDVLKDVVWGKSKKDVLMTVFKGEILQKNGKIFMQNLPQYDKIILEIQQRLRRK